MRILFVTEQFPYPLDTGGNVRTYHLLKGLAAEHEIVLAATARAPIEPAHLEEIRKWCREIHIAPAVGTGLVHEATALARSVVSNMPFLISRRYSQQFAAQIGALCARERFDVVHWNHLDAAMYASHVPSGTMQVLDEHNVVTNQARTTLTAERSLARRIILRRDSAKLADYEPRVCNRMARCLVCSENDARTLAQLGVTRAVVVAPNGVDIEFFTKAQLASASDRQISFVGTLDYDPCEKGVFYFCTEILPLIRRQVPDVRFVVVGRNPSQRLRLLAEKDPGIVLTGRVDDVRPHVQGSRAFAVPLLSGSGTRLKILEAMAMGIPVVSTTIGAEGIDAVDGEHLWIADSPQPFAAAIVYALRNLDASQAVRDRAWVLVQNRYSWARICADLRHEYRSLTTAES